MTGSPTPDRVGLVRLLGSRRGVVAWLLTAAAALLVAGRVVAQFAYPVGYGLRFNAVTVGPGLAGVEILVLLVTAAGVAVLAEPTASSRLIVLVDLVTLLVAVASAAIGLVLTLASYDISGIPGVVTASLLAQLANLAAATMTALVLRRALSLTPQPGRTRSAGAGVRGGREPGRGWPPGYGVGQPPAQVPPYGGSPYGGPGSGGSRYGAPGRGAAPYGPAPYGPAPYGPPSYGPPSYGPPPLRAPAGQPRYRQRPDQPLGPPSDDDSPGHQA